MQSIVYVFQRQTWEIIQYDMGTPQMHFTHISEYMYNVHNSLCPYTENTFSIPKCIFMSDKQIRDGIIIWTRDSRL